MQKPDDENVLLPVQQNLTAMLAIEKVPFETQITFTDEVNNIEAGSTHIGIKPGETLTMKDCKLCTYLHLLPVSLVLQNISALRFLLL